MIDRLLRAGTSEHRLEITSKLAVVLLEHGVGLLDELASAIAVIDRSTGSLGFVNAAWKQLLGDADPTRLRALVDANRAELTHLPDVALGTAPCAVSLRCTATSVIVVAEAIAGAADDRQALDEVRRANRMKDQFIATVSHELRGPVTTLLLWEKVLRNAKLGDELHARALAAIHASAIAQARVVGDLLDVARAIGGKLAIDLRPVDLERSIGDAIDAIGPDARLREVTIERTPAVGMMLIEGDAQRLRQILDNLLSNAVNGSRIGGRVTISVTRHPTTIAIEISDNGHGIDPEFLPHVFEPFSQPTDAADRPVGGLGLGLAIASQLAALHHGSLTAASPGRGRGATFVLGLPLASTSHEQARTASRNQTLERVRILVVDDDLRVLDALALLFGQLGAIVETAESTAAARAKLAAARPDVIVSDIAMPGEDGYAMIRTAREMPGARIPAIALTAYATATDAARAIEAGFDVHLAKPIDFEVLVASIVDVLDRP